MIRITIRTRPDGIEDGIVLRELQPLIDQIDERLERLGLRLKADVQVDDDSDVEAPSYGS